MKRFSFLCAALVGLCVNSFAQNINLTDSVVTGSSEYVNLVRLMQRVQLFNHHVPQEKVYLHFDNTGYFKGETMWFKGYVVSTDTGKPTDMSSVLYVELLDPTGEVVKTQKVFIENGVAQGDIRLDTLYVTGFYEVRAYTRYMMNWGGTGCFSRVFPIFKQPKTEGDYTKMEIDQFSYRYRLPTLREVPYELLVEQGGKGRYDALKRKRLPHGKVHVNFYPEGGYLVEDLTAKVAFAVNDDEGRYFDAEGVIVDAEKQLVQGAVTYRDGRGYFTITPDDAPKYLQLTMADGKQQEFELPEALTEGIALTVNTLNDPDVTATVSASTAMQDRMLGYTLMHDGRIVDYDTLMCHAAVVLKWDRATLPAGVNQLTLFDADGHVLAERLFFICPKVEAAERVKVTSPMAHLVPCGKVKLDIEAAPNANLSVSAIDMGTMVNGKEGNVLTWMLLSSEVKGYIAHPDYYFESDDREHRVAADLLMMVQGWRRYRWQLMAGKEKFKRIHNIEDKLYIVGELKQAHKDVPVTNERLRTYLFAKTGEWVWAEYVTDSLGRYAFAMPNAWGEWNLQFIVPEVYKLGFGKKGKVDGGDRKQHYRVLVDRNFSPQPRWLSPYETDTLTSLHPNLFADVPDSVFERLEDIPLLKRERVLKEVKVKARRRVFDNARAEWESERHGQYWGNIYYNVDKELDRIYDEGGVVPSLYEWLYGRNPLMQGTGAAAYMPTQLHENVEKVQTGGGKSMVETEFEDPFDNLENRREGVIYKAHIAGTKIKDPEETLRIYKDGLSYKNRPIIWIIDNQFGGVTGANDIYFSRGVEVLAPYVRDMPLFLDEVKSVYISEKPMASNRYMWSEELMGKAPVTIFVYTHYLFPWKHDGQRRTFFQAFDKPDTFEMDDYSKIPPMEDFRRTLFWAPDVKTDAQGHATVEFWNNSSARQLYISAEGMTAEGKFLTNE